MVCDLSYLEDWEEKADGLTDSLTELINQDKGVCRTAPAKPSLLNTENTAIYFFLFLPLKSSTHSFFGRYLFYLDQKRFAARAFSFGFIYISQM